MENKQHIEKKGLHERNKHRFMYDFEALSESFLELKPYVSPNKYGNLSVDFANPEAVLALNKAILKYHYSIANWNIPKAYLCPPIPGRAEYLHHLADILAVDNQNIIPIGDTVRILDIGVGANCIYPIIGRCEYGWQFVGSDIDKIAIQAAEKIIAENEALNGGVECRLQSSKINIFKNIIKPDEYFESVICNPPFHASLEEATYGTQRKLRNLGKHTGKKPVLNFGGQNSELWYEGGELGFISNMIKESDSFRSQCFWFSSLVSKQENVDKIYYLLEKQKVFDVKTIYIEIGNKISRIIFWTFLNDAQQAAWIAKRKKMLL